MYLCKPYWYSLQHLFWGSFLLIPFLELNFLTIILLEKCYAEILNLMFFCRILMVMLMFFSLVFLLLFAIGYINHDYAIPNSISKTLKGFKCFKVIRSFVSFVKHFVLSIFPSYFLMFYRPFMISWLSILSAIKSLY